jgi:predicted nucleic acid-binding protein
MTLIDGLVVYDATIICGAFVSPDSVNYKLLELADDGQIEATVTDLTAYEFVYNAYKGKLTRGQPLEPDQLQEFMDGFPNLFDPATAPRVSIGRSITDQVWMHKRPVGQVVYEITGRRVEELLKGIEAQQVISVDDFDPNDLHLIVTAIEQEASFICTHNTRDFKQATYGPATRITPWDLYQLAIAP